MFDNYIELIHQWQQRSPRFEIDFSGIIFVLVLIVPKDLVRCRLLLLMLMLRSNTCFSEVGFSHF